MIRTVFVLRTVLTSRHILLYPSWEYNKALVTDKGALQGNCKIPWHWQIFLAFRPGTISTRYQGTFWYFTAQYASTDCNCMRSFVVKLQPQRNKEIEVD
jgi:hypothetical protein